MRVTYHYLSTPWDLLPCGLVDLTWEENWWWPVIGTGLCSFLLGIYSRRRHNLCIRLPVEGYKHNIWKQWVNLYLDCAELTLAPPQQVSHESRNDLSLTVIRIMHIEVGLNTWTSIGISGWNTSAEATSDTWVKLEIKLLELYSTVYRSLYRSAFKGGTCV